MIKSKTLNFQYYKNGKLNKVKMLSDELVNVINIFIERLWNGPFENNISINTVIDSWISDRLKQVGLDMALSIVKSQKEKEIDRKPILEKFVMKIDSEFIDINGRM